MYRTKLSPLFSLLAGLCLLVLGGCTDASLTALNTVARLGDYRQVSDLSYGPEALQQLDIYLPDEMGEQPPATVVFFYGGCWGGCKTWPKEYYRFVGEALTAQGFVAVLADYRLHPQVKFPQIISDAGLAVTWVARNIGEYGGDPERIVLMGHSAGAHLAAMLTINENYLPADVYGQLSGFVGLAGPYDFLPLTKPYQKAVFGPAPNYPASQPILFVDGSEPPLLLLYGDGDTVVKPHNLENLAAKVRNLDGRVVTRRYANVDHSSIVAALASPLRDDYAIMDDITQFILTSTSPDAGRHSLSAVAAAASE